MDVTSSQTRTGYLLLTSLLLGAVLFCHLFRLVEVPNGFFIDEVGIGLDAQDLLATGRDEHGVSWPVFFRSFGDYKNPVYVYAETAVFGLLGASEQHLRLTSALLFFLACGLFALLLRRLLPDKPMLWLYGLAALGFMPQYFNVSRVAFEVISELPALIAILLAVHASLERGAPARSRSLFGLGLLFGLSLYCYTTNRLFSPLLLAALVLLYWRRLGWRRVAVLVAGFSLMAVPLLLFVAAHPRALTARFHDVSYVPDPGMQWSQKLRLFLHNYFIHFSPNFLLFMADGNLRHTPAVDGVVFWTVLVLAIVGLVACLATDRLRRSPWWRLVMAMTFLAPVPAALTSDETGHVLRSLPLSLGLLLLSLAGLQFIAARAGSRAPLVAALALGLVSIEATAQMVDYFENYPSASILAFQGAGFRQEFEIAWARHPREILFPEDPAHPAIYAYADFYRRLLKLPDAPAIHASFDLRAKKGACLLYFFGLRPVVPQGFHVVYQSPNVGPGTHLMCFDG